MSGFADEELPERGDEASSAEAESSEAVSSEGEGRVKLREQVFVVPVELLVPAGDAPAQRLEDLSEDDFEDLLADPELLAQRQ